MKLPSFSLQATILTQKHSSAHLQTCGACVSVVVNERKRPSPAWTSHPSLTSFIHFSFADNLIQDALCIAAIVWRVIFLLLFYLVKQFCSCFKSTFFFVTKAKNVLKLLLHHTYQNWHILLFNTVILFLFGSSTQWM